MVTASFKSAELYRLTPENERKKKIVWATGILVAGGPLEIECFDFHRTLSGKILMDSGQPDDRKYFQSQLGEIVRKKRKFLATVFSRSDKNTVFVVNDTFEIV